MTAFDAMQLLLASLALACGTYLVWPSRWNFPAHFALGLWFVSVLIPVALTSVIDSYPPSLISTYIGLLTVGAFGYVAGLLLSVLILPATSISRLKGLSKPLDTATSRRRVMLLTVSSCLLLILCFRLMGFVPLLADDPFAAKFFRGAYGAAYRPVAIPYRLSTGLLPLLIGITAGYAWRYRSSRWALLTAVATLLMILTVQRTQALTGVLLVLGVILVNRGRTTTFLVVLLTSYVGGTLAYELLNTLGVFQGAGTFSSTASSSLSNSIALTAPDVPDALTFLHRWQLAGSPTTNGRTLFGGLIPGNYPWNPSVWSVTLGSPAIDLNNAYTGGLRLPAPIWGAVAFGSVGAFLIPLFAGLGAGCLTRYIALAIPGTSMVETIWKLSVYAALLPVISTFYTIGYLDVTRLAALALLINGMGMSANQSGKRTASRRGEHAPRAKSSRHSSPVARGHDAN